MQLGREVGWGQLGETVAMTLIRLVGGGGRGKWRNNSGKLEWSFTLSGDPRAYRITCSLNIIGPLF